MKKKVSAGISTGRLQLTALSMALMPRGKNWHSLGTPASMQPRHRPFSSSLTHFARRRRHRLQATLDRFCFGGGTRISSPSEVDAVVESGSSILPWRLVGDNFEPGRQEPARQFPVGNFDSNRVENGGLLLQRKDGRRRIGYEAKGRRGGGGMRAKAIAAGKRDVLIDFELCYSSSLKICPVPPF